MKSVADAVELQSTFARKQFELFNDQAKDFQKFGVQVAKDIAQPARDTVAKTVDVFKAA